MHYCIIIIPIYIILFIIKQIKRNTILKIINIFNLNILLFNIAL